MFHPGKEPIPGYRLEEFLGRGQFGEVWRTGAPGGAKAALKFIDLGRIQGVKEFRGIQRVKDIRHAHLMPITAIWLLNDEGHVLDDEILTSIDPGADTVRADMSTSRVIETFRPKWLVVAMLLGGKNLHDVLEEYKQQGEMGIPFDKLLTYMEEAAKGIDFLNSPRHDLGRGPVAIQHGDIKPANIMLVGDSVLICDFGVARLLTDAQANATVTATGMVGSPAYMPPECIEGGKPSYRSDQYSFAVTYCELRTGELPFRDDSYMAVLDAHRQGRLDLSRLSDEERPVIRRAVSVDPADRFETVVQMVSALRRAGDGPLFDAESDGDGSSRESMLLAIEVEDETSQPRVKKRKKRGLAIAMFFVAVMMVLGLFALLWWDNIRLVLDPPVSFTIKVTPVDSTTRIDDELQPLDERGEANLTMAKDKKVGISVTHPSGAYQAFSSSVAYEDLQKNDFRFEISLELQDQSLRFLPKDAEVTIDGAAQTLDNGLVTLRLLPDQKLIITAKHDSGAYVPLERTYTFAELTGAQFQIELDPIEQTLQVEPPDADLTINGKPKLLVDGRATLKLRPDEKTDIQVSHASGAYETFQKLFTYEELMGIRWKLRLTIATPQSIKLSDHKNVVRSIVVTEKRLASASDDRKVLVYELSPSGPSSFSQSLEGHDGLINSMAISKHGRWLVTGSSDDTAILWDLDAADPTATHSVLRVHKEDCLTVAIFENDGDGWIATGGDDYAVLLWKMKAGIPADVPINLAGHKDQIRTVAFSPDGRWLLSVSLDGKIIRWDLNANDPTIPFDLAAPTTEVDASRFVNKDTFAFTRLNEPKGVVLLDVVNGKTIRQLQSTVTPMHAVAISPDGRWLATGSDASMALLWDLKSTALPLNPVALNHSDQVTCLAFSPDSKWLVTGSWDKMAALWDLTSDPMPGRPLRLNAHSHVIHAVAISPDQEWIITGSADHDVRVWKFNECVAIKQAQDASGMSNVSADKQANGRRVSPRQLVADSR